MKFRKKPVEIEARQFDGTYAGWITISEWIKGPGRGLETYTTTEGRDERTILIPTLEGDHRAAPGDWIIRGVKGEFYPCKPDIFAATYEPAEAAPPPPPADHEESVSRKVQIALDCSLASVSLHPGDEDVLAAARETALADIAEALAQARQGGIEEALAPVRREYLRWRPLEALTAHDAHQMREAFARALASAGKEG